MTQIGLFVIALFGVPWIISALLPPPSGTLASVLAGFLPTVWAPTILAVIFVMAEGGPAGLRQELKARLGYRRGLARWILLAAAVPIAAVSIAVAIARAAGSGAPFIASNALMQAIVLQIITGAVGEELGWRGFLLPRLGRFVGMTAAAWIMAILWSLWHVPAFFDPNLPHYYISMFVMLPSVAFFGVFMGLMFDRAGGSVLVTMAAHLALNIMLALGGVAIASSVLWGVLAAVFGVVAILMTLASRARALAARPAQYV